MASFFASADSRSALAASPTAMAFLHSEDLIKPTIPMGRQQNTRTRMLCTNNHLHLRQVLVSLEQLREYLGQQCLGLDMVVGMEVVVCMAAWSVLGMTEAVVPVLLVPVDCIGEEDRVELPAHFL